LIFFFRPEKRAKPQKEPDSDLPLIEEVRKSQADLKEMEGQ